MLKGFNHYFKDFIYNRTEEIWQENLSKNKQFVELNAKIIETQHALMETLPSQSQPLLLKFDEAEAEQTGVIVAMMYRQGLIDGIKLAKLVDRYGKIHKFIDNALKKS